MGQGALIKQKRGTPVRKTDITGQQIDKVEHEKLQDLPQDCPVSLVDRCGVALDVLGPERLMLKGQMPLDMACDALIGFAKGLVSVVGKEVWNKMLQLAQISTYMHICST